MSLRARLERLGKRVGLTCDPSLPGFTLAQAADYRGHEAFQAHALACLEAGARLPMPPAAAAWLDRQPPMTEADEARLLEEMRRLCPDDDRLADISLGKSDGDGGPAG